MYILDFTIEKIPKSLNKSLRANRFERMRENKAFDALIHFECLGKMPKKPLMKAHLTITRHSHRTLDFDGLVGSMKPLVDALVSCGVLSDDSWKVLGPWSVHQVFRSKKLDPLIRVIVQEVPIDE
jgi:hypothetical protein